MPLAPGGRGETQQGHLTGRIEAEAKQEAERVHVPALADDLEHGLEQARQQAAVVEVVLEARLVVLAAAGHLAEHLVDVEQDHEVDQADDQQERRRHPGADQATDLLEGRDVADDAGGDRDEHGQRHDDGRVAEREEEADRDRPLAVLHELAGGVVDGRDVIRVDRVAQAEGVGQEGRGQEDRVRGADSQRDDPGADVEGDQQRVDPNQPVAQAARAGGESLNR